MSTTSKTEEQADFNQAGTLEQMMMAQLQNLSDPSKDLDKEIKRANAMSSAATVIINAAKVKIDAVRTNHNINKDKKSKQLPGGGDDKKQLTNGNKQQ